MAPYRSLADMVNAPVLVRSNIHHGTPYPLIPANGGLYCQRGRITIWRYAEHFGWRLSLPWRSARQPASLSLAGLHTGPVAVRPPVRRRTAPRSLALRDMAARTVVPLRLRISAVPSA